uniref:Uncharacterized protein LOC111115371 n=1 Tax=Crassostrea virginica TaxID=6565 RepID=A0A8B8C298_CRAVI|nr:uncharacterized protein LOC111115371 [Crassostrea virginica]
MAADGVSTRWRCAFMLFTILLIGVLGCLCFFYLQLLEIKQELRGLRSSRDIIVKKSDHIGKRDVRDSTSQGKNDNAKGDLESASKRDNSGKRQTASNFMQELLTAQAHILESHCSNDSRLCMRGPKGEKGDSGVISNPSNFVPTLPPRPCACLEEPKIGPLQNTIASSGDDVNITCLVTGNPTPYVTWKQNGVTVSNNAVLHLTNVNAGMSGNYSCVARNLVGDQSKTIVLKVL